MYQSFHALKLHDMSLCRTCTTIKFDSQWYELAVFFSFFITPVLENNFLDRMWSKLLNSKIGNRGGIPKYGNKIEKSFLCTSGAFAVTQSRVSKQLIIAKVRPGERNLSLRPYYN